MTPVLSTEISRLSPGERLALIGEIWDSLDQDGLLQTPAQDAELDHRLLTLDDERSRAVSWDSVKADLSARIRS